MPGNTGSAGHGQTHVQTGRFPGVAASATADGAAPGRSPVEGPGVLTLLPNGGGTGNGAVAASPLRPTAIPRDRRVFLAMLDVGLTDPEPSRFRRRSRKNPDEQRDRAAMSLRQLDPDIIVLHGVADIQWAGDLAKMLLPAFPHIAYRASSGERVPPGGGVVILSRHPFIETRFVDLEPVGSSKNLTVDPGILITTQDAGALGRIRLAALETGPVSRRVGDEPRLSRALQHQMQTILDAVLDPTCPYPTLLLGTPPIWPKREKTAWSTILSAGLVDGLMAAAPPAQQGVYDPQAGGLPVQNRHHVFMRMGDFANMFIDRIESAEGDTLVSLDHGAWGYLPRHRALRVVLTPRVT